MRKFANRNEREFAMHTPIGISNTIRGQVLPLADAIKKTTLLERQKMIEDSPLYDEFSVNPDADSSMNLMNYIDLSVAPLDYTDAEEMNRVAREQILDYKRQFDAHMAQKQAKLKEINARAAQQPSPDVAP